MGDMLGTMQAKETSIAIKVIRADGTVEDYGTVSYWHINPLRRLVGNIKIWFKNLFRR